MIIKGSAFNHARKFARHLMRTDQNEIVNVLEIDSTHASPTLESAFLEYQALAKHLTKADFGLYQASIDPPEDESLSLTKEQWIEAANILEKKLGFKGQPRAIVYHEKDGRGHLHVVWQRTIVDKEKVVDLQDNYKKHEQAARKIEKKFGLKRTVGVHTREPGEKRPISKATQAELKKGDRVGTDIRDIQKRLIPIYEAAETGYDFIEEMEKLGYFLVRGDERKSYMVLGPTGEGWLLSSCLKGHKMRDIKKKLNHLPLQNLKTLNEAKAEREGLAPGELGERLERRKRSEEKQKMLDETEEHLRDRVLYLLEEFDLEEARLFEQQKLERFTLEAKHRIINEAIEERKREDQKSKKRQRHKIDQFLHKIKSEAERLWWESAVPQTQQELQNLQKVFEKEVLDGLDEEARAQYEKQKISPSKQGETETQQKLRKKVAEQKEKKIPPNRMDRLRNARQRREVAELERRHKNQRRDLDQRRRKELHTFDMMARLENKPKGNTRENVVMPKARFEVDRDDAKLNILKMHIEDLKQIDKNNPAKTYVEERLRHYIGLNDKNRARWAHFLELEQKVDDGFNTLFRDPKEAREVFQKVTMKRGLEETLTILKNQPGRLGVVARYPRTPLEREEIRQAFATLVSDFKTSHALRPKLINENRLVLNYPIRHLHDRKLTLMQQHSDERLAALRMVQLSSQSIDGFQYTHLTTDQRDLLKEARDVMRKKATRDKADQLIKENKRLEKLRRKHAKDTVDEQRKKREEELEKERKRRERYKDLGLDL